MNAQTPSAEDPPCGLDAPLRKFPIRFFNNHCEPTGRASAPDDWLHDAIHLASQRKNRMVRRFARRNDNVKVTDDPGFLAIVDPDAYRGFVHADWTSTREVWSEIPWSAV